MHSRGRSSGRGEAPPSPSPSSTPARAGFTARREGRAVAFGVRWHQPHHRALADACGDDARRSATAAVRAGYVRAARPTQPLWIWPERREPVPIEAPDVGRWLARWSEVRAVYVAGRATLIAGLQNSIFCNARITPPSVRTIASTSRMPSGSASSSDAEMMPVNGTRSMLVDAAAGGTRRSAANQVR